MSISHFKLRELFADFWEKKGHKEVPPISLVPQNDPTTLFTSAGMQPLVPYFLGQTHHLGNRLYNIQRCFRSQDIEEVGDNCHSTFFEMMGNWSFGDYFKKDQLNWFFDFLVEILKLDPKKLYVSVFSGEVGVPKDEESISIWQDIFNKYDIEAKIGERIFLYDSSCNWWSRSGAPKDMPPGEPGGPDSEVFYDFGSPVHKGCHPNCQCGRYMEIGNSVFMEYKKVPDGTFSKLPKKSVDFGGGLERIMAVLNNNADIFTSELYFPIIRIIEKISKKNYSEPENAKPMRVVADHLKASYFMASEGLKPSNKEAGYVMRRLIRRAVVKMNKLSIIPLKAAPEILQQIMKIYKDIYFKSDNHINYETIIAKEIDDFERTMLRGTKILQTTQNIDGKVLFNLKQSYGFPIEVALELLKEWGRKIDKNIIMKEFNAEFDKHRKLSQSTSLFRFKGGLADQGEKTIKYHTATHLLHQALFDVLGADIKQEGSNITAERLRFDFYSTKKPTGEEIKKVEAIINQKIKEALPVIFKIMPKDEAIKSGAKSFFREKYPESVKVYSIGEFSKELCTGPHVANTKEIGEITIFKFKKTGSNLYRIYAKLQKNN